MVDFHEKRGIENRRRASSQRVEIQEFEETYLLLPASIIGDLSSDKKQSTR